MYLSALIPARGGSKGIPNKNLRIFKGKSFIEQTIMPATSSHYI